MATIKIAGCGGGSLCFSRVLADLPLEEGLAGSEVVLYDLDPEKAERMAAAGRRLAAAVGTGLRVRAAARIEDAAAGADFGISSIGVSGVETVPGVHGSRFHSADICIAAHYGVPQVIGDTCGPAGMMMAHVPCRRICASAASSRNTPPP